MTEKEISRKQRWRLGIIRHAEEVTHNIAKTCRYFGISRTAFYKWYERYQNYGGEGKICYQCDKSQPKEEQMDYLEFIVRVTSNLYYQQYLKQEDGN